MLTARIQAIDGTRTFTPLDSQLCRLLRSPVTRSPSLTMALSVGFTSFVSSTDATQAKGLLTFTPIGLPPIEHVYLSWTHCLPKTSSRSTSHRINNIPLDPSWGDSPRRQGM